MGVITQKNYHSVMDHISGGREWDLNRKRDGLFILPPFVTRDNPGVYNGIVEALRGISTYLQKSFSRNTSSSAIRPILYKADFRRRMLRVSSFQKGGHHAHVLACGRGRSRADEQPRHFGRGARGGRLRGRLAFNPINPQGPRVMTGTFIVDETLIMYLADAALSTGETRFVQGILLKNLEKLSHLRLPP